MFAMSTHKRTQWWGLEPMRICALPVHLCMWKGLERHMYRRLEHAADDPASGLRVSQCSSQLAKASASRDSGQL